MSSPNGPHPGTTQPNPFGPSAPVEPEDNLLRHYALVLRRRWRWIALGLGVGLIAGIAAAVLIKTKPVTTQYFKATNTLTQVNVNDGSGSGSSYTLNQAALLIQSQQLLEAVAKTVPLSPTELAAQLSASVRPNVNAIDITAIGTQPEQAVLLANTAADVLRLTAQAQAGNTIDLQRSTLQQQITDQQNQIETLKAQPPADPAQQLVNAQRIQELQSDIDNAKQQLTQLPEQGGGFTLSVLRPATPIQINARGYNWRYSQNQNARDQLVQQNTNGSGPGFSETDLSNPSPVSPSTRIVLGGAAGLLLGLISAFVVEAWDDRVRRKDHAEDLTGLPVLAEVPKLKRQEARNHHVAVEDESTGIAAERYRSARTAINFALGESHSGDADGVASTPVIMVTSPSPAEGKTTTVSNIAAAFADDGRRVLVIDGDFRRPAVRRYLSPVPNLVSPDEPTATRVDRVDFLPGPHDALTPEQAIEALIRTVAKWRGNYDLVILDTPPILTTNDAADLLVCADTVLLVLRAGKTRARAAQRVAETLFQFQADTLGVILNGCDKVEMNQYYGYGYGYTYGYLGYPSNKPKNKGSHEPTRSVEGGATGVLTDTESPGTESPDTESPDAGND